MDSFIQSPKTEQRVQMVNAGILLLAPFCGAQFNVDEQTFNTDDMGKVRTSENDAFRKKFFSILHI